MNALFPDLPEHQDLLPEPMFYIEPRDKDTASEEKRQRVIVAACHRAGLSVWHNPQSGRRSDYERTTLHRNGAIAGVADLTIHWGNRGTYYAEIKNGRDGPSRAQINFLNARKREDFPCGVHRGWKSLEQKLIEAGAPILAKPEPRQAEPIGDAARRVILRLIHLEQDPSERKAKIMIAREEGLLGDAETEAMMQRYGLRFA